MNNLIAILLGSALFFSTASVNALEITYSKINPFSGDITPTQVENLLLKGEILPGDYDALLRVIQNSPERFWRSIGFVLASPGGDVQESMKIARLVKGTFKSVFVGPAAGPCVSACFFIFVASARREAMAKNVGIHRPYTHPGRLHSMSPLEAEAAQTDALNQSRLYMENLGVPTNLIDTMFQRASTEVYWLSKSDIEEQLGRRPPWFEQFLIGRCNLDKSLERKYFESDSTELLDKLLAVDACGVRLSKPEAHAFLSRQLKLFARR